MTKYKFLQLEKRELFKRWLLNQDCPRHPGLKLRELENGDIECPVCVEEENIDFRDELTGEVISA